MPKSAELRIEVDKLSAEAEAILNASEKADGDMTPGQKKRWDQIMDSEKGELAAVQQQLAEQLDIEAEQKRLRDLRVTMRLPLPLPTPAHEAREVNTSRFEYRDAVTGRPIRAYSHVEKIQPQSPYNTGGEPDVTLGEALLYRMSGNTSGHEQHRIHNALVGDEGSGGYLVNPATGARVIDLARSASVVLKAGAQTLPLTSAETSIVRVASDPTGHWRREGTTVAASEAGFDKVVLRPHTLAAIVPISIELVEDSPNAAAVIEMALQGALGLMVDRAALAGTGATGQPQGVIGHLDVNDAQTDVNTPTDFSEITSAVRDIFVANYAGDPSGLAWILSPEVAAVYDALVDSTEQPLQPTPWAGALQRYMTTSLSASPDSNMVVGDFSQLLLGLRTDGLVVRILESGSVVDAAGVTHNAASQLKKLIVAYLRMDVALLRPTFFSVLGGVTVT